MSTRVQLDMEKVLGSSVLSGVGLRGVRECILGGERRCRDLYSEGEGMGGDILVLGEGYGLLSEIGLEEEVGLEDLGGGYYRFSDVGVGIRNKELVGEGELLYGGGLVYMGSVVESVVVRYVGPRITWTRNDIGRVRFSEGGELLGGVIGRVGVGRVGDEGVILGGTSGYLVLEGLGMYEIGGVEILLVEDVWGHEFGGGELGVVGLSTGELRWGLSSGERVYYVRGELLGESAREYVSVLGEGYLSPIPRGYESVLLREEGYGYLRVEYVSSDEGLELLGRGRVCISLESGRFLYEGRLRYEGLALGVGVGVLGVVEASEEGMEVLELGESGISRVSKNRGLEGEWEYDLEFSACSYVLRGGELLSISVVDELPSRLRGGVVYYVRGESGLRGLSLGDKFVQNVYMLGMGRDSGWIYGQEAGGEGGEEWGLGGYRRVGVGEGDLTGVIRVSEGGLLSGLSVGFTGVGMVGLISYSDELVGEGVRGSLLSHILPSGYDLVRGEYGYVFRVMGEDVSIGYGVVGGVLGRIEWLSERGSAGVISEPTSFLELPLGSRDVSIDLTGVGESIVAEVLPGGLGVRWKEVYGVKKGEGYGGISSYEGEVFDLGDSEISLGVGDFVKYAGYYRRVLEVLGGGLVRLSSLSVGVGVGLLLSEGYISESGEWEAYGGGDGLVDGMVLVGECFKRHDWTSGLGVVVRKVWSSLSSLISDKPTGSVRQLRSVSSGERVELLVLRDEVLVGGYLDLGDVHIQTGHFEIYVNGVLREDYELDMDTGELVFEVALGGGDEVVLRRLVMSREGYAECYSDGSELTLPELFDVAQGYLYEEQLGVGAYRARGRTISFYEGLESGVGISVEYTLASGGGRVEESVIFLREKEECISLGGSVYSFNEGGLGISSEIPVVVYVGVEPQEGGYSVFENTRVRFSVSPEERVFISYGILGAVGGEFTVGVSEDIQLPEEQLGQGATSVDVGSESLSIEEGSVISLGAGVLRFVVSYEGSVVTFTPPLESAMRLGDFYYTTTADLFLSVEGGSIQVKPKSGEVLLSGDMMALVYEGVLLAIGTGVYRVRSSELVGDGLQTRVLLEGLVYGGYEGSSYAVSVRAIPFEGEVKIGKRGLSVVREDEYVLIREESGLGKGLVEGSDYVLDFESGLFYLRRGYDVRAGVRYTLRHSALRVLGPYISEGLLKYPSYSMSYLVNTPAPERYVGKKVSFSGVLEKRDKFYLRDVEESEYVAEVASELLAEGGVGNTRARAPLGVAPNIYSRLGRDVVARNRIKFYDGLVSPVDNLVSSMSGAQVGAEDGVFKFELDPAPYWGGAGLEDMITRQVLPRNVFEELGVNLSDLSAQEIDATIEAQGDLIRNELDDQVLVGVKTKRVLTTTLPFLSLQVLGVYKSMWEAHRLSRLFPRGGRRHESVLLGGDFSYESNGAVIGRIENPSLGEITNLTRATLRKRTARFRVWDYSATGFSEEPATIGKPTFILSAVNFSEFPVGANGAVNTDELVYLGNPSEGHIPSVETGNPENNFRALSVGDTIELGRTGGEMLPLFLTSEFKVSGVIVSEARARVVDIIKGAYVVVSGRASVLERGGVSLAENPPMRGDTFAEGFTGDIDEEINNTYRVGVDVGLDLSTGELINIALPSSSDPNIPLMEITGQNIPTPLMAIEGEFSFVYSNTQPFEYPALRGEPLNDDGGATLPYLNSSSERDTLASISVGIRQILSSEIEGEYEYPDEIRENGVSITSGVLELESSLTPFTDGLIATKDIEAGDLVLISPIEGDGATGFLEVSTIEGQEVMPPFYRASVSNGVRYKLRNAMYSTSSMVIDTCVSDGVTGEFLYSKLVLLAASQLEGLFTQLSYQAEDTLEIALTYGGVLRGVLIFEGGGSSLTARYRVEPSGLVFGPVDVTSWSTIGGIFEVRIDLVSGAGQTNPAFANSVLRAFFDDAGIGYTLIPTGSQFVATGVKVQGDVNFLTHGSPTASILEDRLTLEEGGAVVTQGAVLVGEDRLTLEIGDCDFPVYELGGVSSVGSFTSDLNAREEVYVRDLPSPNSFRVFGLASSTTLISREARNLSIWATRRIGLYSGECDVGSLEMGVGGGVTEGARGYLSPVSAGDDITEVLPGDLAYVQGSHASGVHRVLGAISESVSEEEISLVVGGASLSIVSVTEVGGTYFLECSHNPREFYEYSNESGSLSVDPCIVLLLDEGALNSASPAEGGVILFDVVISEDLENKVVEVPASAGKQYLDGSGASVVSLAELLVAGRELIGYNKLPFDLSKTGLADFNAPCSIEAGYALISSKFGGGLTDEPLADSVALSFTRNDAGVVTYLSFRDNFLLTVGIDGYVSVGGSLLMVRGGDTLKVKVSVSRGIYLDEDFPRLGLDYGRAFSNYFGLSDEYGPSSPSDFSTGHSLTGSYVERAMVSIGRLRRFSPVFERLSVDLGSSARLYDSRYGVIGEISQTEMSVVLTASPIDSEGDLAEGGSDTQLGDFVDVVQRGDDVYLYDAVGTELAKLRVISVGASLSCQYVYGEIPVLLSGHTFRVKTREGVIPQVQSYDEFLRVAFEQVYSSSTGSVETENELTDTSFSSSGIQVGDYLVIDPAGELENPLEIGAPPQGDIGRVGQAGYVEGQPSPYDDNRGVYKITSVGSSSLVVEPVYPHEGIDSAGYNFLPSVGGSDWGVLRVTAEAVGGSHNTPSNAIFSIAPFSYRVLRKNTSVGVELAEDMLFFRERALSWAEKIRTFGSLKRSSWAEYVAGGYEQYVGEGDISHPSNEELLGLEGNVEMTPELVTTQDCLSLLERRFLCEDLSLVYAGFSEIAPSVGALLEGGLGIMGARAKRYSWIGVRSNSVSGTLASLSRVSLTNPSKSAIEDIS